MPKAPKNTYWRGGVLWARFKVKGQRVRESLRTGDATVARRRVQELRDRELASAHFGEHRHTYTGTVVAWAAWITNEVGAETAKRYAVSLKQLEPLLRPLFLDQIKVKLGKAEAGVTIGDIVAARQAKGASNATIKRDLTALSSVMGYAVDEGWRDDNPVLAWLRPSQRRRSRLRERRDPIVLPLHSHVDAVIARSPDMFGALVDLARKTGCRLSELTGAERNAVDHVRKQLTIRGKGNKRRVIDLEPFGAYDVVRALPAAIGSKWLFWHSDGERFRSVSSNFRRVVTGTQKEAQRQGREFRRMTFHHLRHLHAVDWLKSGRSIYDLQKRLGHAHIATTEIYLAFLTADEVRAVKAGTQNGPHEQRSGAA